MQSQHKHNENGVTQQYNANKTLIQSIWSSEYNISLLTVLRNWNHTAKLLTFC